MGELGDSYKELKVIKDKQRNERKRSFLESNIIEQLKNKNIEVKAGNNENYIINIKNEIGKLTYYPKSNKLLIHKENKWLNDGLKWIIKNLIK